MEGTVAFRHLCFITGQSGEGFHLDLSVNNDLRGAHGALISEIRAVMLKTAASYTITDQKNMLLETTAGIRTDVHR